MIRPCARRRRAAAGALVLAAGVLALASCSSTQLTQIGVTVDDDPDHHVDLDTVEISVSTEDGTLLQKSKADLSKKPLPRTLTLVQDDRSLETVHMTATGWLDDQPIVEHRSAASFQEGELWYLRVVLSGLCKNVACPDDQTCEAGHCQDIVVQHSKPDDTLNSAPNTPGIPQCVIKQPKPKEKLYFGDDIKLEGRCVDAAQQPIEEELQWLSDEHDVLATRAEDTVPSGVLTLGSHRLTLCAGEGPDRLCSKAVPVTVERKPAPPTAKIMYARQEGAEDGGPFSAGELITFKGSWSAVGGEVRVKWTDNFIAEFGDAAMATMASPRVGRHRVTLVVTDEANQTQEPPETVVFDVIDAERWEAGERELAPAFERVNATLRDAGQRRIRALASDASDLVLASNGDQVYAFRGDRLDGDAEPAVADTTLAGVRAIVIDAPEREGRVYLGAADGVTACDYTQGAIPIAAEGCARYRDGDSALLDAQVTALAKLERDDRRWIAVGTERGLWVAREDDGDPTDVVTVTSDGEPIRGVVSSADAFWFATQSSGVYKYDPAAGGVAELYSTDAPVAPMSSLCSDEEGGIWLGTQEHGISRFESSGQWRGPWLQGGPFEGLASNRIQATAAAKGISRGLQVMMLWVGTDHGLSRLDFRTPSFTTLDTGAGLPSDDIGALVVLPKSGNLVIGTRDGLALYDGS